MSAERMILKAIVFLVGIAVLAQMRDGLVEGVKEMPAHKAER
jgi:hypothetical protein